MPAPVTYTNPTPCSQPAVYPVPDGAGSIRITATGGGGAQGAGFLSAYPIGGGRPPFYYYAGGKGGVVTQTIPAVAGSKLYVQVGGAGSLPLPLGAEGGSGGGGGVGGGGNGGSSQDGKNSAFYALSYPYSGAHSGGGGGASGVSSTGNCSQWLVVGGGGGGGGAGFVDLQSSSTVNYFIYGGSGGSGCPVGGGSGCAATDARKATVNSPGTLGKAGGSPPNNGGGWQGGAGATMQGGAGGSGAPGGGGGGAGGGYYGGGGGGGGGGLSGGGGGGGGASFAIPGPSGAPSYGFGTGTPDITSSYVAAAAGSVTITPIAKPSPPLTLSASPSQVEWGQAPSLTAKLPADATGIVGFYDDVNGGCEGNKSPGAVCQGLGTAQIMNGIATLPAPTRALSVGSHRLHASYGGDSHYLPNDSADLTVTVAKASPAMNLHISGTMLSPGQTIKSIAVVMPADLTGTVVFHAQDPNGKDIVLGSAPIKNGSAILQDLQTATQKLAPGPNKIRASYTDDAHYTSGNSNIVVVTKKPS